MASADQVLSRYVETGRHTQDEVRALLCRARSVPAGRPLTSRPWLAVAVPGAVVDRVGDSVVFGVPRAVLDDHALRKISRACPEVWMDGRWYPADVEGFHLVMATTLTVTAPDGIPPEVVALLDVPADRARFIGGEDGEPPHFVHLSWRPPR